MTREEMIQKSADSIRSNYGYFTIQDSRYGVINMQVDRNFNFKVSAVPTLVPGGVPANQIQKGTKVYDYKNNILLTISDKTLGAWAIALYRWCLYSNASGFDAKDFKGNLQCEDFKDRSKGNYGPDVAKYAKASISPKRDDKGNIVDPNNVTMMVTSWTTQQDRRTISLHISPEIAICLYNFITGYLQLRAQKSYEISNYFLENGSNTNNNSDSNSNNQYNTSYTNSTPQQSFQQPMSPPNMQQTPQPQQPVGPPNPNMMTTNIDALNGVV